MAEQRVDETGQGFGSFKFSSAKIIMFTALENPFERNSQRVVVENSNNHAGWPGEGLRPANCPDTALTRMYKMGKLGRINMVQVEIAFVSIAPSMKQSTCSSQSQRLLNSS